MQYQMWAAGGLIIYFYITSLGPGILFVLLTAFIIWPGLSKVLRAFLDWSKRLSFAIIKFSAFVSSSHVFQSPNLTVSGLTMINDSCQMVANCWRSARFSRTRSESFWGPKSMFKSSLSSIFIMDADFAGLVEKVNNFSMDEIFARGWRFAKRSMLSSAPIALWRSYRYCMMTTTLIPW